MGVSPAASISVFWLAGVIVMVRLISLASFVTQYPNMTFSTPSILGK